MLKILKRRKKPYQMEMNERKCGQGRIESGTHHFDREDGSRIEISATGIGTRDFIGKLGGYEWEDRIGEMDYRLEFKGYRSRVEAEMRTAMSLLEGKIVPARPKDYRKWLKGFVAKGGKITNVYDYPISSDLSDWFVAHRAFEISPLFGASSINIIAQEGVELLGGELGHNEIYFLDNYEHMGSNVPTYTDMKLEDE